MGCIWSLYALQNPSKTLLWSQIADFTEGRTRQSLYGLSVGTCVSGDFRLCPSYLSPPMGCIWSLYTLQNPSKTLLWPQPADFRWRWSSRILIRFIGRYWCFGRLLVAPEPSGQHYGRYSKCLRPPGAIENIFVGHKAPSCLKFSQNMLFGFPDVNRIPKWS